MECQAIQVWTFNLLVGAFLDLAITFLLLCGSTLAYAASKFLACFGLSLPCPCNGMFGDPNRDHCLQKFLVENPTQNISAVQMAVKRRFPYDLPCSDDLGNSNESMETVDRYIKGANESVQKESRFRSTERYGRKKRGSLRSLRPSSSASSNLVTTTVQDSVSTNQEISSHGMVPLAFSVVGASKGVRKVSFGNERSSKSFSSDEIVKETEQNIDHVSTFHECGNEAGQLEVERRDENAIWLLEQALEEERNARATLCIELEMERSASASAADEAMAMILRLQEEKAIVEMGARQYKRMVEEKSVFDAEEMNLLKEILIRRERETHYLEKELEAYRQMIEGHGNSQWHDVAPISQMEFPGLNWNDYVKIPEHGDNYETDNATLKNVEMKSSVAPSLVGEQPSPERSAFLENTAVQPRENQENNYEISAPEEVTQDVKKDKTAENPNEFGNARCDLESHVYDVHVVDSLLNKSISLRTNEAERVPQKISLRRNSMSAVDCERIRIESEVGMLREKIRIVQEGREKLNSSLNQKEREKVQLQVLDDMATQLHTIRNQAFPGSIARQSSLPPQSLKWTSRNRLTRRSSPGSTNKELSNEM